MLSALFIIFKRDLTIALFKKGYFFNNLGLFIISAMFLLALLKPEGDINILSITLLPYLFASLLSSGEIFREDYRDNVLLQLNASGNSGVTLALAKILSHFAQSVLILLIVLPSLCLIYRTDIGHNYLFISIIFLFLGIMVSSLVSFAAALTVKIESNAIISCLIVMPLALSFFIYTASILDITITVNSYDAMVTGTKIISTISVLTSLISVFACSYAVTKI